MPGILEFGTSSQSSPQSNRPSNAAVLSHIRGFHTSLPFKRSAALPYGTSNLQLKTTPLKSKSSFGQKRRQSRQLSPIRNPASLKKATFQWVKGELLGKGSYAQVFLALNATTGEVMAVKQVEILQTVSDRSNSRLLDIMQAIKFESNTLKDLDHANIVQYLGYEESPQYLSIFLEYVPGGTISSCLRKYGRFCQEVTKSFTSQILAGLEYLHSKGILHRDLKADNILVEPTGVCKISDFGISKKADIHHGRAFTGMKGTVFWMAPEILSSAGKGYDFKVDIWSVGCIVLEMWTGDRPWSGEELLPVMMKLFEHKLPPPVPRDISLSEDALDFRSQCFQMDPQDRPSAAELQKHPYLTLPNGWRFEFTDLQRPRRSLSMASSKSRKSMNASRQPKPSEFNQHIPPVPPIPTALHSGIPVSDAPPNSSMPHGHPDPEHGPQLVFITPPGSPVQSVSGTDHANESFDSQKLIGFYVVNADPEPDANRTTFIYSPPPLPGVDNNSPYSARLAPPSQHHVPYHAPVIRRSIRAHSTHSAMQPFSRTVDKHEAESSQREGDGYYDSDDSDVGTSFWNRPPVDLTAGGLKDGPTHSVSSRSSQIKKAMHHEEGVAWAPRPVPEEVYDHLQQFFPHHDLDKAIIEVGQADSTPEDLSDRRRHAKKSIRMVAEEQINRNQRGIWRKTKLWDSNVKELRT